MVQSKAPIPHFTVTVEADMGAAQDLRTSLNAIDPVDVHRSYRMEQGFTFELNLSGVSDEARDAFVSGDDARYSK